MSEKLPEKDPREKGLFRFFINQNVFINIVYIGIFITGLILWNFIMNREAFGNFDFDLVQITTPYPGATAEEIETLVTLPLENALKPLQGIDEMWSVSVEGVSVVTIQLDPDSATRTKDVRTIEREVETVRVLDLPEDGDEPNFVEITAAFPVLTLGLSGDIPDMDLRNLADDLEDEFLSIDGVSRISMRGYKNKEIWVEANLNKLGQSHLSLLDLVNQIRAGDHNSPGGRLELEDKEIIIRSMGKLETVEDVERVVVRSNEEGKIVRVGDVATVTERLERERKFTRLDGSRSIEINVLKKDSGNTLKITDDLKRIVKSYKAKVDPRVKFGYANEISFYIERRLNVLIRNGLVGIILVMIIMVLFLSPQSAFWSTTAIPFAFLGGLVTMHFFGMTINLLSLFAFILVSGMLVDNGIVVSEYIERKRSEGLPTFTAVAVGVSEMALPVFAAALTTIIAFAPLAFMTGITGKFLRQMPLVLIACLVSDLIECLFILPGHLYHYDFKIRFPKFINRIRNKAQSWLARLTEFYKGLIGKVVQRPFRTMLILIVFFIVNLFLIKENMRYLFFPKIVDAFTIQFELPVGAKLSQTEAVAIGFENIIKELPEEEIDAVVTQVGSQGDQHRSNSGTNVGQVQVFLMKSKVDRIPGEVLLEEIRPKVMEYGKRLNLPQFELEELRGGPPSGKAIEVIFIGDDYGPLIKITDEVKEFIKDIDGTYSVVDDYKEGKDELRLKMNREAIARARLRTDEVATVIRAAFDGQEAIRIKRVGEPDDIKVKVKLPEIDRTTRDTLNKLTITNARGNLIPVMSLITVEEGKGLLTILRNDAKRTITVKGEVDFKKITPTEVNSKIISFADEKIKKYPGIRYKFGGEKKNQDESMRSLLIAFFVAIGLIYLVLATLLKSYWDPVIIISVVPFGIIGVLISMVIPGKTVTLLVSIGCAGLAGVVINNSILLIETFNRRREQHGKSYEETVIEGSTERLRPILLTSFSTFFGVMPLGYGLGGKEPILQDMAYSFGWGLLLCSFITIFWIPSFFVVSIRVMKFIGLIKED